MSFIGIDFGNLNICISQIVNGNVEVLTNNIGKRMIANYITLKKNGIIYDHESFSSLNMRFRDSVYNIKKTILDPTTQQQNEAVDAPMVKMVHKDNNIYYQFNSVNFQE